MILKCEYSDKELCELVNKQLQNFWPVDCFMDLRDVLPRVLDRMKKSFEQSCNKYIHKQDSVVFCVSHSVSYAIFLYLISNELYKCGKETKASHVYYLNKIMHSVDWFYAIELPKVFMAEHPLGTVLGRAVYNDYFMIYQGCTVGGNRGKEGGLFYPSIGHHVTMFSNSTVLGNSHIGNYVVTSAGSYIKDTDIPDNSIVFGRSPELNIKRKTTEEIKRFFTPIWKTL